jgi:hypothetical protein
MRKAMLRLFGLAWPGLLSVTSLVQAGPKPTVVELFTSEGCSSCPPAEAMIGVLAQRRPDVIALAFHVDYWDYIGWRDRFELPEATERQRRYSHALRLNTVYTPQLVVDGQRDQVGGNDAATVPVSTRGQGFSLDIAVREEHIEEHIEVSIGASTHGTSLPASAYDVLLVSYLPEGVSKITRGENSGRELHEFNIVRSLRRIGTWTGDAATFSVPLKSLPGDATQVAVLVQGANEGPIIGAATHAVR